MWSCFGVIQPSMWHFRNSPSPFAFHWTYFKVRRVWKYTTNLNCEAEVGRVTLFVAVWNPLDLISHRITHTFSNKLLNKCAHFVCPQSSGLFAFCVTCVILLCILLPWFIFFFSHVGSNTAKVKPKSPHIHFIHSYTCSHALLLTPRRKERASQIHLLIPLHWIILPFFAGVCTEIIIPLLIRTQINLKWIAANVLMGEGGCCRRLNRSRNSIRSDSNMS